MTPHKHAEVLRAVADGVPLDEFEIQHVSCKIRGNWSEHFHAAILAHPEMWSVRRKPQSIMVNGFKVPKPLENVLDIDPVYVPALHKEELVLMRSFESNKDLACMRGIAHATPDAAIAHAKAMLGIDPQWEAT